MATKGGAKKSPPARKPGRAGPRAARAPRAAQKPPAARKLPTDFPDTRYLFFGGKGGVGKTTAAAATALALLDAAGPGESVLLFSTDPAHSLSDSLDFEVGDRTAEVARRGAGDGAARLYAREMDAAAALEAFKRRHRAVLAEIAERGTILDEADVNDLLDLSLPGMDEVMALFELSEVERAGDFARVVVDTAPSGHTTRMLRLPEVFARWVGALDVMSEKHRYMVAHFARRGRVREDDVDLFLRDLTARVAAVRATLFDAARSSFVLVTMPEAMAFEESARYFAALTREGAPVTDVVVNRVERARPDCPFCRARARMQSRWLDALSREFTSLRQRRVPLFPSEVRGAGALREFGRALWQTEPGESPAAGERVGRARKGGRKKKDESAAVKNKGEGESAAVRNKGEGGAFRNRVGLSRLVTEAEAGGPARSGFRLEPRRLVIFGGKGGVGKTTAAAAYALALAETEPSARVLVFSTDPAHSLSDSFAEPVGELKRGAGGAANLDAMEIDPAARFEELKERYRRWTDELFESLTGGSRWEVRFDREAMRELVALAPPGIDELAALSAVGDLLDEGGYTTIVLDTAPTGHLLRFLELPRVALAWVRTFIKLLLKYRNVVRWGGVAEELVALSKSIKRVAALLTDAEACEFVGVAIPERMSLEETARLAARLEDLRVPMLRLVVNNVLTAEVARACEFCAARRRGQTPVVGEFLRRLGGARVYAAPGQPREVRGPAGLRTHFAAWRALDPKQAADDEQESD